MRIVSRLLLAALCLGVLTACSLPRGAAMRSEILETKDSQTPTFAVVEVGRGNIDTLIRWPRTGWSGRYHWIAASRGPASPVIRTGDRIDMVIWDNQENSLLTNGSTKTVEMSNLVVSSEGTIFVPYIDEVVVRGLTPSDARRRVQAALAAIAPSAQVQLSVAVGRQNSVDLVSGVAKPGSFAMLDRDYTILSLIAEGGGISSSLRNPLVRLIRDGKTYEIRAERLFAEADKNALLRGGDRVLVEEDKRYFTALGATGQEELVYFPKEHVTALEAISIAGGLMDSRANPEGVLVFREYPRGALRADASGPAMQQVVFTFDLTSADGLFAARKFPINPGDTVLATESPVTAAQTIFGLLGTSLGLANRI